MSRARELANYRGLPSRIVIPDLQGLIMAAVLRQSIEMGFTLAVDDPPAPIKDLASSGRWVVGGQDPAAGSTRYRGDTVVVTLQRFGGGEAGDREPRNPLPRPLRSLAERTPDEPVERLGSVHHLDPLGAPGGVTIETPDH
ncbi:MAG: PASTA domain-containing protein [Nakamurella sp.]